jgi:F420-non-reducing hydrogenase iron-sulfur subunit
MAVGLYLSRCRGSVGEVVDLESLASEFAGRAEVVRVVDDVFDPATTRRIEEDVAACGLTSLVLAGDSRDHYTRGVSGRLLLDRLAAAGVNPNRIVTANLLQQVAMAHADDPAGARAKAAAEVSVALRDAALRGDAPAERSVPKHAILVLGATRAGAIAAERLLRLGYAVWLADRGDVALRLGSTPGIGATAGFVLGHPACTVLSDVKVLDADGWVGDFRVTITSRDGSSILEVGGLLLAEVDEPSWVTDLREHYRIDIDDEGRARSVNPAAHPGETIEPGVAVATASERDPMAVSAASADAAVMALLLHLSYPETTHHAMTSVVDAELCGGCASCVKTCAFGACWIDAETGLSHVDVRRCRGCGKCVVGCPVGARDILSSPHASLLAAIEELAAADIPGPRILGFLCGGCGYPAADQAGEIAAAGGATYPAGFLPIRIPCGGRLDTLYVLAAFRAGFDGVAVFRCREGHCHNVIGNLDMDRRMSLLRTVLRSRRLDGDRLRVIDISPTEGERFVESVNGTFALLASLTNGKGGPQ